MFGHPAVDLHLDHFLLCHLKLYRVSDLVKEELVTPQVVRHPLRLAQSVRAVVLQHGVEALVVPIEENVPIPEQLPVVAGGDREEGAWYPPQCPNPRLEDAARYIDVNDPLVLNLPLEPLLPLLFHLLQAPLRGESPLLLHDAHGPGIKTGQSTPPIHWLGLDAPPRGGTVKGGLVPLGGGTGRLPGQAGAVRRRGIVLRPLRRGRTCGSCPPRRG
mmetsp:Transcript_21737/g.50446  ORF Transcript_21737/g.50446 Transcript_21737/m.50446 type:complete len:216 (+) Transcript_21737:1436-2083(+)